MKSGTDIVKELIRGSTNYRDFMNRAQSAGFRLESDWDTGFAMKGHDCAVICERSVMHNLNLIFNLYVKVGDSNQRLIADGRIML
jgi:hypothetical protein